MLLVTTYVSKETVFRSLCNLLDWCYLHLLYQMKIHCHHGMKHKEHYPRCYSYEISEDEDNFIYQYATWLIRLVDHFFIIILEWNFIFNRLLFFYFKFNWLSCKYYYVCLLLLNNYKIKNWFLRDYLTQI